MSKVTQFWRLDTPHGCREFLKTVQVGPDPKSARSILFLQQADGKQVSIDEASDEQVMQVAQELAEAQLRSGGGEHPGDDPRRQAQPRPGLERVQTEGGNMKNLSGPVARVHPGRTIDDGREDVKVSLNGHLLITIHEEGYKASGLTFDQAKEFGTNLVNLIAMTANVLGQPEEK